LYPTQHAALTAGAAVPLRLRGWSWRDLALFWAAGVFIDGDHYLSYAWRTGDFSLANAYKFHKARTPRTRGWQFHPRLPDVWPGGHRPFHALSVLAALLLVSRFIPWMRPIAWGAIAHRLEDLGWEWFAGKDRPIGTLAPAEIPATPAAAGGADGRVSDLPATQGDALQSTAATAAGGS
jgi:hypothetical protein